MSYQEEENKLTDILHKAQIEFVFIRFLPLSGWEIQLQNKTESDLNALIDVLRANGYSITFAGISKRLIPEYKHEVYAVCL